MLQKPLLNMGWYSEILVLKLCFILPQKTANMKRLFERHEDFKVRYYFMLSVKLSKIFLL